MLKKRILSAFLGIALLALFILTGSIPFYILTAVLIFLGLGEYVNLLDKKQQFDKYPVIFSGLIIITYAYLHIKGLILLPFGLLVIFILLCLFIYHILVRGYQNLLITISINLFGLLYIGGGMVYFMLLREFNLQPFTSTRALWLALLATWAADTGAYFTGRFLGSHKLAEIISPNKTWEGVLGGILLSTVVVIIFTAFLNIFSVIWFIYGILAGLIAIAGDLFASCLKRDLGVKDSGDLIPGHGGFLDRFDSLLFTLPFTYYYLIFLLR